MWFNTVVSRTPKSVKVVEHNAIVFVQSECCGRLRGLELATYLRIKSV